MTMVRMNDISLLCDDISPFCDASRQETKIPEPSGCYRFAHGVLLLLLRLKEPKYELITHLGLGHLIQKA